MKYLKLIFIIVLICTSSCRSDLIPEKKMSLIIADIYKADRYVNSKYMLLLATDTTKVYEPIFNHYGFSAIDFTNTIEHYLSRPAKLKSIYSGAKAIIEEQDNQVSELLRYNYRLDSIRVKYTRLLKNADSVVKLPPNKRAIRWLIEPLKYPRWSFSYNDSIRQLYETPQMDRWWLNNFKKDSTKLKFTFIDEKNSRTVSVPPKLRETHPKRPLSIER